LLPAASSAQRASSEAKLLSLGAAPRTPAATGSTAAAQGGVVGGPAGAAAPRCRLLL
jgi:hypothetical protein